MGGFLICPGLCIHSQSISWQLRCLQAHPEWGAARRGPLCPHSWHPVTVVSPVPTQACQPETAVMGGLGRTRQRPLLALGPEVPPPAPGPHPHPLGSPLPRCGHKSVLPCSLLPHTSLPGPCLGLRQGMVVIPCCRRFQHREPKLGRRGGVSPHEGHHCAVFAQAENPGTTGCPPAFLPLSSALLPLVYKA